MQKLGPLLQFLGCRDNQWGVSILVVTDAADAEPSLSFSAAALPVTRTSVAVPGQPCTAWRFDFAVPQTAESQSIEGQVGGQSFSFSVPARGSMPSMAYASCNGFSDSRALKKMTEPHALWARLGRLHTRQDRVDNQSYGPFDLLLLGGDQVYSDAMWALVPELVEWTEMDWYTRTHTAFTVAMQASVQSFFSKLYMDRWSQPDMAAALRSMPSVMMWDDHDLMDGWGSYPSDLHESPVFQGIFRVAKAAFELFQRQMMGAPAPATLPDQPGHTSGYRIGPAGLLVLDLRSERRPRSGAQTAAGGVLEAERIMSEDSWRAAYQWLDAQQAAGGMTHLFVMSSIPVVHPSFATLEKMLGVFPGLQTLEDDLRDHWNSPPHKAERLRLIHRLLVASEKGTRITLLSGDVHVAALGVIESDRTDASPGARVINQLTSSGIVHPAPPGVALHFLEQACLAVDPIDRGITGTMVEFPTTTHRMIGCRNFLTLQPDEPGGADRYWANWWAEGEPHPYTKVIHAVG
jgi:hypothetical protein